MARNKRLTIKFVVCEKTKRVVVAESDADFVDTLLSLLTLPLGTIVRLLDKQSGLGCLDRLYESVENLDISHFQTEACKTMLLRPLSAAALCCEHLKLNINDDSKPKNRYTCDNSDCCSKTTCFYSYVENARCPRCDKTMEKVIHQSQSDDDRDGVFVRRGVNFIISDDLHIIPSSLMQSLPILNKISIKKETDLKERILDVGKKEMLFLLKRSLISKTPLSDLCFRNTMLIGDKRSLISKILLFGLCFRNTMPIGDASSTSKVQPTKDMLLVKIESNSDIKSSDNTMKLLLNKVNNRIMFFECGEYLTNLAFSFLTFPLGSVIKLLNKNSSIGCVDNIYTSVEGLSLNYIKSKKSKSMLLAPKLPFLFGLSKQMFNVDEICPPNKSIRGCLACYWKKGNIQCTVGTKCDHGVEHAKFVVLNPKSPKGGTEAGGGYAKGPGKFLMTEDLCVSSFSTISAIRIIRGLPEFAVGAIVDREAEIGESQALSLLKAALISKTPLTDVFSRDNKCSESIEIYFDACQDLR